jgi:hypothetical protein
LPAGFRGLAGPREALRAAAATDRQPGIDVPGSFGRHLLLPALPEFLARYPGIEVELRFNERIADLVKERVDLAVRGGPVTDPNLVARPVAGSRWIFCASPAYLARSGRPQSVADLARHALVGSITAETGKPRPWLFPDDAAPPPKLEFGVTINEMEAVVRRRRMARHRADPGPHGDAGAHAGRIARSSCPIAPCPARFRWSHTPAASASPGCEVFPIPARPDPGGLPRARSATGLAADPA